MPTIQLWLDISSQQFRAYYDGRSQTIRATSLDGRVVDFPASILRQHLRHDGVRGLFELQVDDANRVVALNKR